MAKVRFEAASQQVLPLIYRLSVEEPEFWHIPAPLMDRATFDSLPKRWFVGNDIASGKVLGYCALSGHDPINRSGWIGVLVARELRNAGVVVPLARGFAQLCFDEIGLHTLMSNSLEGSPMCILVEKFEGWRRIGVVEHAQFIRGQWRNRVFHQAINPRERGQERA